MGWQGKLRRRLPVLLIGCVLVLGGLAAGCARAPDEQRLREAIAAMEAAAEARQPAAVVEWVSTDFTGSHGLDRDQLRRLLQARMIGRSSVGVALGPLDIEIDGPHATVRFVVLLTGGSGRLLPDQARGYAVVSQWRLEDGEWRVHEARWDAEPD
jgi:hypothetical protein